MVAGHKEPQNLVWFLIASPPFTKYELSEFSWQPTVCLLANVDCKMTPWEFYCEFSHAIYHRYLIFYLSTIKSIQPPVFIVKSLTSMCGKVTAILGHTTNSRGIFSRIWIILKSTFNFKQIYFNTLKIPYFFQYYNIQTLSCPAKSLLSPRFSCNFGVIPDKWEPSDLKRDTRNATRLSISKI